MFYQHLTTDTVHTLGSFTTKSGTRDLFTLSHVGTLE